jgi:nucleoside-diphosphate-sugar epimerase
VPTALLRLSGIYGPGRNALMQLSQGTARRLVKPGQVFNRIHVGDIATAVAAAARLKASGVFNVTDDEPASPQDVIAYAAQTGGYPLPPEIDFETADLSPMARSFYGENKRVGNGRLAADLGIQLAFPSYREGIAALWRDGSWRG